MKRFSPLARLTFLLSLLPFLLLAVCWHSLPAQVPTNWGFDGAVTYSSKNTLIFLCATPFGCGLLLLLAPYIDPHHRNIQKFQKGYEWFCLILQLFLLVVVGIIFWESYHPGTVNVKTVTLLGCGLLFIVLGNQMPRMRHNYFIGIRTPWTLASETVWVKTHRVTGRLFFALGFVLLIAAFLPDWIAFAVVLVGSLGLALGSTVYSYLLFQKESKNQSPE